LILQGVLGWVGFEMVRTTFLPLVATSAFIGYTQATQPWLIQPVSVFSIYGLNTVIMLVNYALAQAAIAWYDRRSDSESPALGQRMSLRWLAAVAITLAAWIGLSLVMLSGAPEDAPTVRAAALRANYPLPAHHDEVNNDEVRFDTFSRQAYEAADQGAEILFTSEMMFNFDPQVKYTEEFQAVAAETDTWIFIAYSVIEEGEPSRNETVLLSPDGTFSEVYNKTHIPPGEAYDVPGGNYPVFETPFGTLGALICADGNYTDITRYLAQNGAQLIAAGYKEFPGFGEQLWQNTIFRAVENHTSLVVTGATSVAAIVDPYGKIVSLDVNKEGSEVVLIGDVSLGSGEGTLYTRLGDILGWVTMLGWVGLTVYQSVEESQWKKQTQA
jgi:apolipoprotein N-acyltransferase